jgi:hypothetical protein
MSTFVFTELAALERSSAVESAILDAHHHGGSNRFGGKKVELARQCRHNRI